jgi:hypothetical protein
MKRVFMCQSNRCHVLQGSSNFSPRFSKMDSVYFSGPDFRFVFTSILIENVRRLHRWRKHCRGLYETPIAA